MHGAVTRFLAPVHPRACGERLPEHSARLERDGSSPRLRGTRCQNRIASRGRRFIPAPAGNARSASAAPRPPPVHPRACGERSSALKSTPQAIGSSPRLRGTRPSARARLQHQRFIPAPAGNAPVRYARARPAPVHPRACGERQAAILRLEVLGGSSPRLRGTPYWRQSGQSGERFIPAPAGNATNSSRDIARAPVHPRACGERVPVPGAAVPVSGSSPRLRGTRLPCQSPQKRRRFIPAPAGNAKPRRRSYGSAPVHPRACGERSSQNRLRSIPDSQLKEPTESLRPLSG